MSYNPTNWTNEPSTATPINATNLNKLEQGVKNATQKAESADNVINNGRLSTSGLQTELANIAAGLHPEAVSDVFIAGKIADPASQTNAELSAKYVAVAEKGSPSGIATLDSTTKVPVTQLPLGAIADSPELSATYVSVRTSDGQPLAPGTIVVITLDKTLAEITSTPVADIADITFEEV